MPGLPDIKAVLASASSARLASESTSIWPQRVKRYLAWTTAYSRSSRQASCEAEPKMDYLNAGSPLFWRFPLGSVFAFR